MESIRWDSIIISMKSINTSEDVLYYISDKSRHSEALKESLEVQE